jgi:SAM-dependent methyltransferase
MKRTLRTIAERWLVNSSRVHLRRVNAQFADRVSAGMFVLDAGAGTAPYRDLFLHANYETADFEKVDKEYAPSTYVCDLASIPVEDGRFDFIVFNQVMEHLPDPLAVLTELRRVLKPGGSIICTCPLFYHEHETPYDFYRYTQFGHRYLFERAGFEIDSLDWLEGWFGTVGYQLEGIFRNTPLSPSQFSSALLYVFTAPLIFLVRVSSFLLAGLSYRLDIRFRYTGGGFPKNYVVIASRASRETNG